MRGACILILSSGELHDHEHVLPPHGGVRRLVVADGGAIADHGVFVGDSGFARGADKIEIVSPPSQTSSSPMWKGGAVNGGLSRGSREARVTRGVATRSGRSGFYPSNT